MNPHPTVPRWQRLLFGLVATAVTLFLVVALFVAQDLWHGHWIGSSSGAGLMHVPDFYFVVIAGRMVAFAMYLVVVVPLVLLWPVRSQLKHWYAFLCAALHNLPALLLFPTLPVLCGVACYLLLLRYRHARLHRERIP
jgi:hypothetical protein